MRLYTMNVTMGLIHYETVHNECYNGTVHCGPVHNEWDWSTTELVLNGPTPK